MLLACGAWAQSLPAGITKVASVEGITEYRLENGLRVLLFPDQSRQTATVNITYLVGSRHESYGETGMAHLLEHLVFKGTPRHPNITKELTDHGARPNGTTWYDRTNYFETFQATEENLRWALDLEADRMVNSFIARKDLDSEMTVVRNEFERGENSPVNILGQRVMAAAYIWHNYGKSTIGSRADIENVNIERLQAFYRKYYQPDNAVLTVAGKIDTEATLKMIAEYFGKIPKPARVIDPTYTEEPVQDGERFVTLRRVGDIQALNAVYHIPALAHPDSAPLEVLSTVLGSSPTGRLYKALIETRKAASAFADSSALREPGFFEVTVLVRKDSSLAEAKKAMLEVVDGIAAKPITGAEVEQAKTDILKNIELNLSDSGRVGLSISETIASGDWRLTFMQRDRIRAVKAADVQRVALAYLKPDNRTMGEFIPTDKPDRAEIPAAPDVMSLVKDYRGGAAIAEGEVFEVSPSNIESRTERGTLASGLKYALLPKKTRGNKVNLVMVLRFGDEESLKGKETAAQAAASLLNKGTATMTKEQIKLEFDKLKARAGIGGGPTSVSMSVETVSESIPGVLKLWAEIARRPSFPAAELEEWRQARITNIENGRREPTAIVVREMQRHMNPYPKGDVRYVNKIDEDLAEVKAVTIDQVKAFYQQFYGATFGELAAVGDFDAAEVKKLTAELFGDWKTPAKFARIKRKFPEVPAVNRTFETPDKQNSLLVAGMPIKITDEHPDYPALVLGNYMLGGGFLSSRLAVRIRQKEGLSYGVGSNFGAAPNEEFGNFAGSAISAPQNTAKVEAAMIEEIRRAYESGFTEEEVQAAKKGWLQSQQVNRGSDQGLALRLASDAYNGRTMSYTQNIEAKVDSLTTAEVNAAFKKYMDPSRISIFKAGDFAKAKAAEAAKP
jgi:zinc protease